MVQSVELLLEPRDEARVVRLWEALLHAGLPSQARHTAASNRPHVTLVAVPAIPSPAEARLRAAVGETLPASATWGEVTPFGRGPWTVVRLVQPSAGMRALQTRIAQVCQVSDDTYSAPSRWTPHVTLARRVSASDLPQVLDVLARDVEDSAPSGTPITATAVRRWDGAARREWRVEPV